MKKLKYFVLIICLCIVSADSLSGCGSSAEAERQAYLRAVERAKERAEEKKQKEEKNKEETTEKIKGEIKEEAKEETKEREETKEEKETAKAEEESDIHKKDIVVKEPETAKEPEETKQETAPKKEEVKEDFKVASDLESINRICGLTAEVETNIAACRVDTINGHNPYDVIYDFGEEYQAYIDACDWSLVFDADYYMDTFPMLALQYHYDEDLLLEHFQTIGIHEGRQGSDDFNVKAYMENGKRATFDTFNGNLEGYYFYYMLNYDTEKNVNTTTLSSGKPVASMYKFRPTALQAGELEGINEYREKVNSDALTIHVEVCALANYRAYLNAHDGWKAHDWAIEYTDTLINYGKIMGGDGCVSENTCTFGYNRQKGKVCVKRYADSEAHYNAMVNNKFAYMGASNMYNGKNSSSQFDVFVKDAYAY